MSLIQDSASYNSRYNTHNTSTKLNKNFNNDVREEIIASNEPIVQDIDGDGYGDYVPLSAYFNDYSEEENTDNNEITILSSYMYYVGRD